MTATGVALASDLMKIYAGKLISTNSMKNLHKIIKTNAIGDDFKIGSRYSFLLDSITTIKGLSGKSSNDYIMVITANSVKYHFVVYTRDNYSDWENLLLKR